MNTSSRRILLVCLVVLSVGFGIALVDRSRSLTVMVQSTGGDAIRDSGGIVLPGTTIFAGETLRTHRTPLDLRSADGRLQLRLMGASRLRIDGSLYRSDALNLTHFPGRGMAYTAGHPVVHGWEGARLVQEAGRLAWRWRPPRFRLTLGTDFRGHWTHGEDTVPVRPTSAREWPTIRSDTVSGQLFDVRNPPLAARRITSLIPPDKLLDRLAEHRRKHGTPDSLRDVFGHWVRDRWGTVYLYVPENDRMTLISAGPDGQFYTPDDRRWGPPDPRR